MKASLLGLWYAPCMPLYTSAFCVNKVQSEVRYGVHVSAITDDISSCLSRKQGKLHLSSHWLPHISVTDMVVKSGQHC